jgi:hypothetical protein
MLSNYDIVWSELNARLRALEGGEGGLPRALAELRVYHQRTGFIRDSLESVGRHTFYHPGTASKFFRIQYNPKRALRFNGVGTMEPPAGVTVRNDGCFLCRENISWQQGGTQLGYEIPVGETTYFAWMNPFPLLPNHIVVATAAHTSQDYGFKYDSRHGKATVLSDLVALAARLPGYVGFFNGVDAGASIPGHMHYQFCQRPEDAFEFPLERAARAFEESERGVGFLTKYPVEVAIWRGTAAEVVETASRWVLQWTRRNRDRLNDLTANFIASKDPTGDDLSLYFVPRARREAGVSGLTGLIGGLEILGEVVFSRPEEKQLLDDGAIDYFALADYLARVRTPMFPS